MEQYVLRTEQVTKQFHNFLALDNVSITLESGKIYGLIGKNGAGKTTLMRQIAGLSFPTKGSVSLFGSTDAKSFQEELKRIGCLIETPTMNGAMTAKENLKLHRIMRGIPQSKEDDALLEMVGLQDAGKKKVKNYSLGMKQRLGIAIALIANPELLILDEPVNGLDPVGVIAIRNLIKQICKERHICILISSHNLPELFQTATDYIIIDHGVVKQTLTLEELEERCRHHLSIECEETEKAVWVLEEILHTNKYKVLQDKSIWLDDFLEDKRTVMKAFFEHEVLPTKFAVEGETLESYFLSVIGGEAHA